MAATVELAPASNNPSPLSLSTNSSPLSSPQSSRQSSFSSSKVSSYLTSLKISSMIKLWPSTLSPFDSQLTPKAGPNGQERPNPFEVSITSTTGSQTPQSFHHHLLNTHLLTPAVPRPASGDLTPHLQGAVNPSSTAPGGNLPALPTTHLSLHAPDFNMRQPPPSRQHKSGQDKSSTPSSSSISSSSSNGSTSTTVGPSKGQIHVKLIQARGLNVRSVNARPYVVVQFEQNEFISREPADEMDKEVKGTATALSRNGSSNALSALSAIGLRAPRDSSKRAKSSADSSPSSSGKSSLAAPNTLFGRLSAHNPVWKHKVSLYVYFMALPLGIVSYLLQRRHISRILHYI